MVNRPETGNKPVPLWSLRPGQAFALHGLEETKGVLIHANESRARVKIKTTPKLVSFSGREFWASATSEGDWCPDTLVVVEEADGW